MDPRRFRRALLGLALLVLGACRGPAARIEAPPPYAAVVAELERCIEHELAQKAIPALSIALVDGDRIVWARGFGEADPERHVPATAATTYRVGSVSKLFTDLALVQLVEEGRLSLDAPVTDVLPDLHPASAYRTPITLRHLTAHQAGLVREPPVGHYFDSSEPTLEQTVASLGRTALVAEPGTLTKYSNAGLAVLGEVIERATGKPYPQWMEQRVLGPLGMEHSSFSQSNSVRRSRAKARMWSYDGRLFDAPSFALGIAPAGSLDTNVLDLAQFLRVLFAGGDCGDGTARVSTATLESMWAPTTDANGNPTRFGIGFALGELDGERVAGHGGAVYGFSTELSFLPARRLGVVVTCSLDVTNAVTSRLAEHALRCLRAVQEGSPVPSLVLGAPVAPAVALPRTGTYRSLKGERADLVLHGDRLTLEHGGQIAEVRDHLGAFVVDDRHTFGRILDFPPDGSLRIAGQRFERVPPERPADCPAELREYLGEYGPDYDPVLIRERDGRLEALIEWFWFDEITRIERDRFLLPRDRGLYPREPLLFERDTAGRVSALSLGGVRFARREALESGATFRVPALHDTDELRRRALAAEPPKEEGEFRAPDLVELKDVVPDLVLDIRYATTNNFLSTVFYPEARAFAQRPAALALREVQAKLAEQGLGLIVYDAYRPWHVTKMFWDGTPADLHQFVADPSQGSRHNRGCALDLGLVDRSTREPVPMPAGYDEFSARSYPEYPGGTALERWHRELLRTTMESRGFQVYEWEWWHFDFRDYPKYPIGNVEFAQIPAR